MEIQYLDNFALLFRGKKEQVLVDGDSSLGVKFDGRVVISTKNKWSYKKTNDNQVLIAGPGEYEVGGVEINGYSAGQTTTVYVVAVDGVSLGILGEPAEELSEKKIERIDALDVLFIPLTKESLPKLKAYLGLAKKWGANYLIPVAYESEVELKMFLDQTDSEGQVPVDGLKVNRDELPEGVEVVVLKKRK